VFLNATFVPDHKSRRVTTKTSNQIYTGVISDMESTREAVALLYGFIGFSESTEITSTESPAL
jgi:hypothetical protein